MPVDQERPSITFGDRVMIALAPTTRIFIYTDPTDMRKSFNGLSGIVKEHFGRGFGRGLKGQEPFWLIR